MTKRRNMGSYEEFLIERLKDPKKALACPNATLMDEDQRVFRKQSKAS